MSLTTVIVSPSLTAIPADSWPRCWRAKRPRYARWATGCPGAYTPKTPHAWPGRSSIAPQVSRTDSRPPVTSLRGDGGQRLLLVVHRPVGIGQEHDRGGGGRRAASPRAPGGAPGRRRGPGEPVRRARVLEG